MAWADGWRRGTAVLVGAILASALPISTVAAMPARALAGSEPVPVLASEDPAKAAPEEVAPGEGFTESSPPGDDGAPEAPVPEKELVDERDRDVQVFENSDGSLTVREYSSPVHHDVDGTWVPIDNALEPTPDRPGWISSTSNDWTVSFGPSDQGLELETSAGTLHITGVPDTESAPVDPEVTKQPPEPDPKDPSAPPAAPSEVTYPEISPDVDARYTVSAGGVKEDLLLKSSDAPASQSFDIDGADLVVRKDGSVGFTGPLGELFEIPAPTVAFADGSDATGSSGVAYSMSDPNGAAPGQRLTVTVDAGWLKSLPSAAFPVAVDPTLWPIYAFDSAVFASPTATRPAHPVIRLGREAGGRTWRGAVRFNQYEAYLNQGYRVYSAYVGVFPKAADGSPVMNIEVYDQGAAPTTHASIGNGKPLLGTMQDPPGSPLITYVSLDVAATVDGWVTGGLTNRWFGLRGNETGTLVRDYETFMDLTIIKPPAASYVDNLADGQVLATTTPTLQARAVPSPEPANYNVRYEFQITTTPAPGTGLIVSYTPDLTSPTTWQVPQGTLQEGQTYYAWVLTSLNFFSEQVPPTQPDPVSARRKFTVDLGLGEGGPSPTDEVGAVPGQAATPAEGAPGPSLPASKVTVNLVDGNLSLTTGTKTLGTLSGGVALGFTYNSLATSAQGLRGEFYNDTNSSGAIDTGDVLVGERTDPTVSFDWGPFAQPVAAQDPTKALARWSGFITLPTSGNWELGAISSDGLRATVNGTLRLDRWATHEPESAPVFGTPFSATAGTAVPIVIEWRNSGGLGVARVVLRDSAGDVYELSPSFLTRNANVLPHGWTFNANAAAASWVGLADRGTSVSLFAADGSAHEFTSAANGSYTSPATAPNDLLSLGDNGRFVLRDAAGSTYTFKSTGVLESLVTAGDDRNPAALTYGYSGSPARLRTITDPVSNRAVTLSYGGDAACTGAPAAAAGLLCHIAYWDSTATTLTYDTSGRFIRLTNPGTIVHDFAYDATGRLTQVRDPLAYDAIAAGVRANDVTALTQIAYDSNTGRVQSVTQPAPSTGASRPARTYSYNTAARTAQVAVAGFTPTVGYAQRVKYDSRNRIVEENDSAGLATRYEWDALDRLVATTDPAGLRTETDYDHASRPIETRGPVPTDALGFSQYHPVDPVRIVNTSTATGTCAPLPCGRLSSGEVHSMKVAGLGGVPAAGVEAVVLNVVVLNPTGLSGFLQVWPSDAPLPDTSNINYTSGSTIANAVVVPVGSDGWINLKLNGGTADILIDVEGWYAQPVPAGGAMFHALDPVRLVDTRVPTGTCSGGCARFTAGQTKAITIAGQGGVPANATAVSMTLTAVSPASSGYAAGVAQRPDPADVIERQLHRHELDLGARRRKARHRWQGQRLLPAGVRLHRRHRRLLQHRPDRRHRLRSPRPGPTPRHPPGLPRGGVRRRLRPDPRQRHPHPPGPRPRWRPHAGRHGGRSQRQPPQRHRRRVHDDLPIRDLPAQHVQHQLGRRPDRRQRCDHPGRVGREDQDLGQRHQRRHRRRRRLPPPDRPRRHRRRRPDEHPTL